MKNLITTSFICIALVTGKNALAETENFDTSTIPILFYADDNSYRALSPWYSFQYQDNQVNLQTCAEQACIQSLQFKGITGTEPFAGRDYQPSYKGQANNIKQVETYSQLNLGHDDENKLYASGNQRRILFALEAQHQPASLNFEFTDDYQSKFDNDKYSLTRTSEACSDICETTWQAFNVDEGERYTPAEFVPNLSGGWTIKASPDAIRIELTTLIGRYQQPLQLYYSNDVTLSSYSVNNDSLVTTRKQGQLQRHHLTDTQVSGLGENRWLLEQEASLVLTTHDVDVVAERPLSELQLSKTLTSDITSERIYILGLASVKPKTLPTKQIIMVQYPQIHEDELIATQLLELDHNLNLVSSTTVHVPESDLPHVEIKQETWGVLVGTGEVSVSSISHTYQTNQSSSAMLGCPMINGGYGYGLLCWKALNNPALTYTPSAASTMIPTFVVDNTTPTLMNELENNQHGIIFKNGSTPVDPNGSWTHPNNTATSKEDLALATAMYHYRWNSPVAANIVYPAGSPSQPVMFRAVKYNAANSSHLPHNVCNHFAASSGYPEYQAADACMTQPDFGLFTLTDLTFDRWVGGVYDPNKVVTGTDNSWFPWFTNFVGDPPVTEPFQQAATSEMIDRIRHYAGQYGRINQDTYVNGQLSSQASVNGYYLSSQ